MFKSFFLVMCVWSAPRIGWACSIIGPGPFEIDEGIDDDNPPALPGEDVDVRVIRGRGPTCYPDGSISSDSCADIGSLEISFLAGEDEEAPEQSITGGADPQLGVGYRFAVVDGLGPIGLGVPSRPMEMFFRDGRASTSFTWIDGASDIQEPFDLTLRVWAVDLAGNESDPIDVVITDPGKQAEHETCTDAQGGAVGCAVVSGGGLSWAFGMTILVLCGRRRRH
ncbi:MAG: GlyGly-CTERM sorting domain-containing protein [Myxococcota bacterium]